MGDNKRNKSSIDGLIRRPARSGSRNMRETAIDGSSLVLGASERKIGVEEKIINPEEMLFDEEDLISGRRKGKKKKQKNKRKAPLWTKILIGFLVLIIVAILGGGAYIYTILTKTSKVFEGNPMDILIGADLAKDEYGKTNVLVFGTAEDDAGHDGAMLTDSILVLSIDQKKKNASTFSIPRDLWVDYTVAGEKKMYCVVGYKGKINAEHFCAQEANGGSKEIASKYFSKKIAEITGLNIQYYVAVDFTVLRDLVNTLGGIDVDVHATDERGIFDICMGNLRLQKGLNKGLDGDTVLRLARARNAQGGYGLSNSNFDREINQQRIINAIKDKALNIDILTKPMKVVEMIDAMGKNLRTNITLAEMRTFIDVAAGLQGGVKSIDTKDLFTTGTINSQSVVIPSGASTTSEYSLFNYLKIQNYLRKEIDKNGTEKNSDETEKAGVQE